MLNLNSDPKNSNLKECVVLLVCESRREGDRGREGEERESGLEDGGTHIDSQLAVSLSTADEVVLPVLECTPYCEE